MSHATRIVGDDKSLPVALHTMKMALADVDKIGTESKHGDINGAKTAWKQQPPPH